ncbi:hypothetical protein SDC9_184369 [bioreactor metagenome]|uniref:Uncharacterized protein n=1 Tax=bioreactor metagenome TaxID=1076179 RepID=A0A645HCV1_9ZZZZ
MIKPTGCESHVRVNENNEISLGFTGCKVICPVNIIDIPLSLLFRRICMNIVRYIVLSQMIKHSFVGIVSDKEEFFVSHIGIFKDLLINKVQPGYAFID